MNVGYFRTWCGNFMVTDNLRVTPADYSPYCVTVPVDARRRSAVNSSADSTASTPTSSARWTT